MRRVRQGIFYAGEQAMANSTAFCVRTLAADPSLVSVVPGAACGSPTWCVGAVPPAAALK
jgi:hypothetical protein